MLDSEDARNTTERVLHDGATSSPAREVKSAASLHLREIYAEREWTKRTWVGVARYNRRAIPCFEIFLKCSWYQTQRGRLGISAALLQPRMSMRFEKTSSTCWALVRGFTSAALLRNLKSAGSPIQEGYRDQRLNSFRKSFCDCGN
jgi:hypothetical protein